MPLVFWESKENLLLLCIKAFSLWTALILATWGLLGCGMVSGHISSGVGSQIASFIVCHVGWVSSDEEWAIAAEYGHP